MKASTVLSTTAVKARKQRSKPTRTAREAPRERGTSATAQLAQVYVRGASFHFPENVVATANLIRAEQPHRIFDLRERRKMGVKYVRIAGPDDTPSSLATIAAQQALENAGIAAESLDMVVTAGCTPPDFDMWSMPAKIAKNLGATRAQCFGIGETGCAAAFAALRVLVPLMQAPGGPERVLLVAGCVTPGGHFFPPATIYGDGAGALVLERSPAGSGGGPRIVRADFYTKCDYAETFGPSAGLAKLRKDGKLEKTDWTVKVKNQDEMDHLVDNSSEMSAAAVKHSLVEAGWKASELRWLIPDNVATAVGIDMASILELPEERVLLENCMRYGHAWVVDLFVNLATILNEHPLAPSERVACLGVGQGHHWGVLLLEA